MVVAVSPSALVAAAEALQPQIAALRDEAERTRRLPAELVQALKDAGLFRLYVPAVFGGLESDPLTFLRVLDAVAQADGSTAWNLMIGSSSNAMFGFLPQDTARDMIGASPDVVLAGTLNPRCGRAHAAPGGYRITGRWPFASGVLQSDWIGTACIVFDGDAPRRNEQGTFVLCIAFVPTAAAETVDTWRVVGMRGTGSNDYLLTDLFVPEERILPLIGASPVQPGPLYRIPIPTIFNPNGPMVMLGIARTAIQTLVDLAGGKRPAGDQSLLRERASVQSDVARAEGLVRSARAFLLETVAELWDQVCTGESPSQALRALVRTAGVHAASSAVQAVDLMYNAGGASSIYESSPLERCFRDVHTASQHILAQTSGFEVAGKVFLGLDPGSTPL